MTATQYPAGYNPKNAGTCLICGVETKAHDKRWLDLCPQHWQALDKTPGVLREALRKSIYESPLPYKTHAAVLDSR